MLKKLFAKLLEWLHELIDRALNKSHDSNQNAHCSEPAIEQESKKPVVQFSKASQDRLKTCAQPLQDLAQAMLQRMDITVVCGYRGEKEQNAVFAEGRSKLKYPNSKHNKVPALAVDLAPFPINWSDVEKFKQMCSIAEEEANKLGIKIRLGRDFSFKDYPHIELN